MTIDLEGDAAIVAAEDAAFASGFPDKPIAKTKPEAKAPAERTVKAEPRTRASEPVTTAPIEPPVEHIQITRKEWEEMKATTAAHAGQFSKAFGTIGNIQKLVNGLQAQTPTGRKVEIPKDAFAAMERDFPELAKLNRDALEAALSGMTGTGANMPAQIDEETLETFAAKREMKRELAALEEEHPDWRTIVGAVSATEKPDANNPFRKWLATKPARYQNKLNASQSAAVISAAIDLFQREAKPAGAARPRDEARVDRIKAAVQPRGDNAGAAAGKTDDEEFEAGFNSR